MTKLVIVLVTLLGLVNRLYGNLSAAVVPLQALNYNKYSSASDVWSFGMVLFEIWSMGEKPFNDLSNPIVSVR